jgi:hypothetical protein
VQLTAVNKIPVAKYKGRCEQSQRPFFDHAVA